MWVPERSGRRGEVGSTTSVNFLMHNLPLDKNASLIAMNTLLPIKTHDKKAK
jgi:hypothetical protein